MHDIFASHFTDISSTMSQKSAQKLQGISNDPILRDKVEVLHIHAGHWAYGESWVRHSATRSPNPRYLETPNDGTKMLSSILTGGLPNCHSLHLDLDTVVDEPAEYPGIIISPSDILHITLCTIASTGVPFKEFAINYASGRFDSHFIDFTVMQSEGFSSSWETLESLTIGYDIDCPHNSSQLSDFTISLINQAKNLRKLHLKDVRQSGDTLSSFNQVTLVSMFIADHVEKLKLHRLEHLILECQFLDTNVLPKLFSHSRDTLRHISLSSIMLVNGYTWKALFQSMQTLLPNLSSIHIHGGYQDESPISYPGLQLDLTIPGTGGANINVQKASLEDTYVLDDIWTVSYEGPEMHTALGMLADSAQFLSLPERTGIWMKGMMD